MADLPADRSGYQDGYRIPSLAADLDLGAVGDTAIADLEVRPAQGVRGRYLRVRVPGLMSWFFADEIIIR